ncbi:MAG: flagellar motor protein [Acidobacteriota bacterium]
MKDSSRRGSRKFDKGTLLGLLFAVCGIVGGLLAEKGTLADVSQGTAALIVFGGTLGAILIGTPLNEVWSALQALKLVFFDPREPVHELLEDLINFATRARRNGIVSLDSDAEQIDDPFLKKALIMAIDGLEATELRTMMEMDLHVEERRMLQRAKVFERAGGYAPTIGIIGAVLGLIQVMKSLANIDEVGRGIAVSFVATLYGVGSANLLFLPAANKIRNHVRHRVEVMELVVEGVAGIVEGMNPRMLRRKLETLAGEQTEKMLSAPDALNAQPAAEERVSL